MFLGRISGDVFSCCIKTKNAQKYFFSTALFLFDVFSPCLMVCCICTLRRAMFVGFHVFSRLPALSSLHLPLCICLCPPIRAQKPLAPPTPPIATRTARRRAARRRRRSNDDAPKWRPWYVVGWQWVGLVVGGVGGRVSGRVGEWMGATCDCEQAGCV
jgi:hypothetical protein